LKWLFGRLAKVSNYLITFGPFGLFAIALLDGAFVPMAGGPDAVVMLLSASRPGWMVFYAGAASLGSTAGCIILYYLSKRGGRRALARFSPSKQARVKDLIERYDVLSVLVASLLPPPFPFKLFVVSAGVFRLSIMRFAIAIFAGRAFRYLLEGYLAARYGDHAKEWLAHYYPAIGISLAVLIVLAFIGRSLWRHRQAPTVSEIES
jgi:membrane protein YqaA with SNARE-associated domain